MIERRTVPAEYTQCTSGTQRVSEVVTGRRSATVGTQSHKAVRYDGGYTRTVSKHASRGSSGCAISSEALYDSNAAHFQCKFYAPSQDRSHRVAAAPIVTLLSASCVPRVHYASPPIFHHPRSACDFRRSPWRIPPDSADPPARLVVCSHCCIVMPIDCRYRLNVNGCFFAREGPTQTTRSPEICAVGESNPEANESSATRRLGRANNRMRTLLPSDNEMPCTLGWAGLASLDDRVHVTLACRLAWDLPLELRYEPFLTRRGVHPAKLRKDGLAACCVGNEHEVPAQSKSTEHKGLRAEEHWWTLAGYARLCLIHLSFSST